jgi:hypothetical protein
MIIQEQPVVAMPWKNAIVWAVLTAKEKNARMSRDTRNLTRIMTSQEEPTQAIPPSSPQLADRFRLLEVRILA